MQQQLEPEEQAIDATKHAPTAPPRDKVKKPNGPVTCTTATEAKGPDATALTGIGENEPATTPSTSAEENITGTVIEKKHKTVCTIHRHIWLQIMKSKLLEVILQRGKRVPRRVKLNQWMVQII